VIRLGKPGSKSMSPERAQMMMAQTHRKFFNRMKNVNKTYLHTDAEIAVRR
jgi:hypothetical protein